jgi:hypothetical protein
MTAPLSNRPLGVPPIPLAHLEAIFADIRRPSPPAAWEGGYFALGMLLALIAILAGVVA